MRGLTQPERRVLHELLYGPDELDVSPEDEDTCRALVAQRRATCDTMHPAWMFVFKASNFGALALRVCPG